MNRLRLSAALTALVLTRCAATTVTRDAQITAQADASRTDDAVSPDASRPDAATVDAGAPDATTVDASVPCAERASTLAAQWISPREGRLACSIVVRVAMGTLRPIAYQSFCGRYANPDEAAARATAQRETMAPELGEMVNAAMPEDAYIFYQPPTDVGAVTVVSARVGATVFRGVEVWAGHGDITFPTSWRDAAELGDGCAAAGGIPHARGYAVGRHALLPDGEVEPVVAAVARTAVPAALWQRGYVFDAVVFGYWRATGGGVDPAPEWIVVVNGGWLE